MTQKLKDLLPHLLILLLFAVASIAYFHPLLKGKELPQGDFIHSVAAQQELVDFEKANPGEESQWTNSMFSGMPAYQIKGATPHSVFNYLYKLLKFGMPYGTTSSLFLYFLGFYVLLLAMKFDKWLAFAGAAAFALGSYNIIIIAAGHINKTYAIAFMAPALAGVLAAYRGKLVWGTIIATIGLGLEIAMGHIQIIYYLGIMILLLVLAELIKTLKNKYFKYALLASSGLTFLSILAGLHTLALIFLVLIPVKGLGFLLYEWFVQKEKEVKQFLIVSGVLVGSAIFAVLPNITNLTTTYEYGKYTIRGESELTSKEEKKSSGLDKSYALSWSYGIGETWTLMFPDAKGGASGQIGNDEKIKEANPQHRETVAQQNRYWGNQQFTAGPVYFGAAIMFLFILGLFFVKGHIKWWILSATVLSILLSWGSNFEVFTDFFFYKIPFYNKFRTVSMTLVIASVAMPILAMLAVKTMIDEPEIFKEKKKLFFIATGIAAGLAIIFAVMPQAFFAFLSRNEVQGLGEQAKNAPEYKSQIDAFIASIEAVRIAIFKADAWRSFAFIAVAAGVIYAFGMKLLKKEYMIIGLILIFVVDLWSVDKRYLNEDSFKSKAQAQAFRKTKADEFILKDTDPNYRVLNLTRSVFNDGSTPYYHKAIGGYHGAKLRRYQDLIESQLAPSIGAIMQVLQGKDTLHDISTLLPQLTALNMLNTKYLIYSPEQMPIVNMNTLGNAWFISDYKLVDNADEEIAAIMTFNPKTTAVIDKRFSKDFSVKAKKEYYDFRDSEISLTSYKPNELKYKAKAKNKQIAIFSEVYYEKGWNAYIDGKLTPHFRANYVLRALEVPEGEHEIVFKFEPKTFSISQTIALVSSILVVLLIGFLAYKEFTKKKEDKDE